jgi:hypothetical protein
MVCDTRCSETIALIAIVSGYTGFSLTKSHTTLSHYFGSLFVLSPANPLLLSPLDYAQLSGGFHMSEVD